MANTTLQLKKSGETGNVPPSLAYGELALNYADGKLFYKAANGTITYIQSGGGSGSSSNSFATINVNSSLILATSPTDTLSFVAGNNVTISACTISKTITINSTATGGGGATANLTSVVDTFNGDGSVTSFSLSVTPISINYTTAVVGGVTQPRSAYSIVGTTLTFTSAPANNQIIEVTTLFGGGSNVTSAYVENSNSVILVTNTVITGNCTVAANTGGLSVGPVVINTNQTVTVANNARWVIL